MIEEIPIDVSEEIQPEPVVDEPLPTIEEDDMPAPKKRGRPPGARNRAKPKVVVVAKRKPRAPPPPPSEEEEEEDEDDEPDTPRIPLRRTHSRASAPSQREYEEEVLDARSVAAEMLQMLSRRNADKHQAKRNKYASWFPNNAVY